MKRRRAVQLVALGGLTLPLAGCTDEASQADENSTETDDANDAGDEDDAGADADDEEEPDEDDDSVDEPDEQEFSGSGDDAVEDVSIEGGLTVVDATYEGEEDEEGDFEVRLIPEERLAEDDDEADDASADETDVEDGEDSAEDGEDGAEEEADEEDDAESVLFVRSSFVDSSSEYEGQTAHPVDEGTYVLSVVADGDWEVTVRQPRAESGDEPPISVDGDGNEIHGPYEFDGSYQPSGDYDGERIIADIYSPTGDTTEFVFHEDSIEDPAEFEFDGVGYLAVKSDGEWSVEIE